MPPTSARLRFSAALLVGLTLVGLTLHAQRLRAAGGWYIRPGGVGGDGQSWDTAWSLAGIDWAQVQPGDTLWLAPGTYTQALVIGKSGLPGAPIKILAAGPVVIDGGRRIPLPECDQTSYANQTTGVLPVGIDFGNFDYVTVDGLSWRGITVHAARLGINLGTGSTNDTVRYVELYDNGTAWQPTSSTWRPDQPGVRPRGTGHLFERDLIHDNGQDGFQTGQALSDFTLRESWVYNARPHSTRQERDGSGPAAYNYCMHPDAVQTYGGGTMGDYLLERDVIGPGLLQGVLLGQTGDAAHTATVNRVTIRDVLFYGADNASIMGYNGSPSQGWVIEHVTSVRPAAAGNCQGAEQWHNILVEGSGHRLTDSIIVGGCAVHLPSQTAYGPNISFGLDTALPGAHVADPQFVNATAADKTTRNFALKPGSPAEGYGSSITSAAQLLALGAPTPTATVAPPPTETLVPTDTATPTSTETSVPSETATPTDTATPTATFTETATSTSTTAPSETSTVTPTPTLACLRLSDGMVCFIPYTPTP